MVNKDLDEQFKDETYKFLKRKNAFLAEVYQKNRDYIDYDFLEEGLSGTHSNGKIVIGLNRRDSDTTYFELCDDILISFHEIGHRLDTKSDFLYESEFRARKFEYSVGKKLGGLFKTIVEETPLTKAAGEGNHNEFGRLFNEDQRYREKVGKLRKSHNKKSTKSL